jgi:hypothetical protein
VFTIESSLGDFSNSSTGSSGGTKLAAPLKKEAKPKTEKKAAAPKAKKAAAPKKTAAAKPKAAPKAKKVAAPKKEAKPKATKAKVAPKPKKAAAPKAVSHLIFPRCISAPLIIHRLPPSSRSQLFSARPSQGVSPRPHPRLPLPKPRRPLHQRSPQ